VLPDIAEVSEVRVRHARMSLGVVAGPPVHAEASAWASVLSPGCRVVRYFEGSYAGFTLWQHAFVESRWLHLGGRFHWLWIRANPLGFVVAEEFEPLERREGEVASE
jgi:hypothetical protein